MKTIIIPALLIATLAGGATIYSRWFGGESESNFRLVPVKQGDLIIKIDATGTLQPEEVVDVGAQIAGKINTLGPDSRRDTDSQYQDKTVDFNTPVKEGMVLATIDDAVYRAVRDQNKASLDRAKSDLLQMQAKLDQAVQDWKRAERLYQMASPVTEGLASAAKTPLGSYSSQATIKGISESDYDLAKANYEVAKANVEVGRSVILQAEASLQMAETNLGYTVIKSPVNGTVIARRVNVGQTVVSSLNAPSLFLIAQDLRRMEVWASVNEADIGRLSEGMPVRFTVDTYPDDEFEGKVAQIRMDAQMTQNVVTFTVVISTDNPDLKLRPYLTADVDFIIDRRPDVLMVPNAALNWHPQAAQVAPAFRDSFRGASSPGGRSADAQKSAKPKDRGTLWVKDGEFVRPMEVRLGATDGLVTEVSGEGLEEGLQVVAGETRANRGGDAQNPFAPPPIRGRRSMS